MGPRHRALYEDEIADDCPSFTSDVCAQNTPAERYANPNQIEGQNRIFAGADTG